MSRFQSYFRTVFLLVFILATGTAWAGTAWADTTTQNDILLVSGSILNPQGKGVKDAEVRFYRDGQRLDTAEEVTTDSSGNFETELHLPPGSLPGVKVTYTVGRPSYKTVKSEPVEYVLPERVDANHNHHYLSHVQLTLKRAVSPALWIATAVLLAVYVFIAFELMHRTLAALVGASALLFISYTFGTFDPSYRILSFEDAMHAIDGNVIFLLMAMMIIVGILKKTGVFQWFAYKSFQLARGNIYMLAVLLMIVTAVVSAFLDNVTTMLLIVPVSIEIALALKVEPIALLMPEVFASNVGGTATLIGDPPNIMIGSFAHLTFVDFITHLTVICLVGLAVAAAYFIGFYRKDYHAARVADVPAMTARLREEYRITNPKLLWKSGGVLAFTIGLFIFHGQLHMEPSIAAMAGASILLVISNVHIVEMVEKEIEWPTLIFFMMLFIIVAGAEQTGVIQIVADWVREASEGSPIIAVILVLWVSAIFSAIIDNIPFTATMLPIVAYLTHTIPGAGNGVLWWALSLGACLGGNGTMIGASANVVTVGLAEKAGHPIGFMQYMKIAMLPMLITVTLAMFWLLTMEMQ